MASSSQTARGEATVGRVRRFVEVLADDLYADALASWARTNGDLPMPTRGDAVADARDQARLLFEGLGEWAALPPTMLDLQQQAVRRAGERTRQRNAWPRRDDEGEWWRDLW